MILSTSCTTNKASIYAKKVDTISYKDYVEIVTNATEDDKNIFIFTTGNCPHCQKISPYIDRYYNNDIDDDTKIYKLSLEYKKTNNEYFQYVDTTMGYCSGADDDCIKILDERIGSYLFETNNLNDEGIITDYDENHYYSYIMTPLFIFYSGKQEVKIINAAEKLLETDENNNKIKYDSFKEMMSYPESNPNWNQAFDLIPYNRAEKTARSTPKSKNIALDDEN